MNHRRPVPWLILLIGGGFLALTAWSIYQATQGVSNVTDRNYYSHGLRYNETLLEKKAAETLGWTARFALEDRDFLMSVEDKEQQPVSRAEVILTLLDGERSQTRVFPLKETSAGQYRIRLPGELRGEFSAKLSIERDGARQNKRVLMNLD